MDIDVLIAANYHPDYPILNGDSTMTTATHIFKIDDLRNHKTTFQVPKDNDGTLTIFVKDDKVHINVNTDFVENYEKQLSEQG